MGRMEGRARKMGTITTRMAMATMTVPKTIATEVAKRLNVTTATFYTYVNSDGSLKEAGQHILSARKK